MPPRVPARGGIFFVHDAVGKRVAARPVAFHGADNNAQEAIMAESPNNPLPPTFNRLAWSNLAAQSAEQIALAAAPIVAVLLLGVGEGQTGLLQTALTLPIILFAIPRPARRPHLAA